jgi:hypothetical protein
MIKEELCQDMEKFTCHLKVLSHEIFYYIFLLTLPSVFLHRTCDKSSTFHNVARNHGAKCPHFTEKLAGHHKCVKKNPVTKHPHFAFHLLGHHKCPKIMKQNAHISLKSQLDITNTF